jgi:hypothetical protein
MTNKIKDCVSGLVTLMCEIFHYRDRDRGHQILADDGIKGKEGANGGWQSRIEIKEELARLRRIIYGARFFWQSHEPPSFSFFLMGLITFGILRETFGITIQNYAQFSINTSFFCRLFNVVFRSNFKFFVPP